MNTSYKWLAVALSCMLGMAVCAETGEAAKKKKEEAPKEQLPVVVEGDEIYFQDTSGDLYVKGNAFVEQGLGKIAAEFIRGNARQETVFVDEEATLLQPDTRVVGDHVAYNYGKKTGNMEHINGKIGNEYVIGGRMEVFPDHYVIYDATMTRCNAHVPDYRLTASKIIIWPNQQMISYDNKVWLKNTVIYSVDRNKRSLRPEDQDQSEMPKVGINSNSGFYIEHTLRYPIDERITIGMPFKAATHTKDNRFASYLQYQGNGYSAAINYGEYEDGDDNSVWKQPEFSWGTNAKKIGTSNISYTLYGTSGMWKDKEKRSWHQVYGVYFSHSPIKLSQDNTLQLHLGTGYEQVLESYNHSRANVIREDIGITKNWRKANAWLSWHNRENQSDLFSYDSDNMNREIDYGFHVQVGKKDALEWNERWDAVNSRVYDRDISWIHNLHCWELRVMYRAERHQLKFTLATAHF
ncbi:hypothetical protein [Anaeromusa acidaminophila]|uniref:hypothetical protein n=1 Tax=Anaeromusa acidaminophila TaxID=81464 RepID=UPI0003722C63|nr:hypothetical protein [Anaeromusa acidaminophila]